MLFAAGQSYGQSKLNISSTVPAETHLCANASTLKIEVRNISTTSVSGIEVTVSLPAGMTYLANSLIGTSASEKNIGDLNKPVFSLGDLKITESHEIEIDVQADCNMATFLNKGGIPKANITGNYTGGSASHTSLPFTIKQPSLSVFSVSNQFVVASKGDTVYREIQLKNSGDGQLPSATFFQTNQSGLKVLGVSGGLLKFSADTIYSDFDSSFFKQIGNKDKYWGKGEVLRIFDTLLVEDCSKFQSKYELRLNCYTNYCSRATSSANITLKNISPILKFTPVRTLGTCNDLSTDLPQGLTITNTGTDTARVLVVNVFQSYNGGFYKSILSQIDTASITYQFGANGKTVKYRTNSIHTNNSTGFMACLGSNSIGGFDAILPDLAPGDTIFLKWNSQTCCSQVCGSAYYKLRWRFSGNYRDQCDQILTHPETWGSGGQYTGIRLAEYMPTDVRLGDTSKFNLTITSGYLYGANARSKTEIIFVLPKGVNHSLKKPDFRFEHFNGSKWEPNTITKKGDSLIATFIGTPKVTFARSELKVKVFGDCSSSSANKNSSYKIFINFNPDTSCTNQCVKPLYCYTGTIRTHCNQNCSGGLKFSDFDAERISLGLADNDNNGLPDATGKLDRNKIRLERVMYGDTLLTSFRGRVNRRGTTVTWTRMTAKSTMPYGRFLTVADARIKIYRSGSLLYSCPNLASTITNSGNNRTFTFDLSTPALIRAACPLYSGFQYFANDSIELEVKYLVSTNPGNFLREISVTNEFYLHTVANPNASQKYQCDTFAGKFVLTGSYFTNWGKNTVAAKGCDVISFSQNYYLSVGNCCGNYAGGNLFPFEYRNWAKPSALIAIPPIGYDLETARWTDYRTAGTGKTSAQIVDTIVPLNATADTLVFPVGQYFKDSIGKFELSDDGFHGTFNIKLRPNCEAENVGDVRYGFVFERKNYLGTGFDTVFTSTANDVVVYSKPKLKITALSTDVTSLSDTVEWQIRLENTSADAKAENSWIGSSDNGNTQLVEVYDIDAKTSLTLNKNYFKVGLVNPNESRNYLVRAVYQSCGRDSFDLWLGYNCREYPDSAEAAQCEPDKISLKYEPLNTRLESIITPIDTAIDLCKDIEQVVSIANTGNSKAFNIYYDLFLRKGMTLKDTAWLFIPGQTDSIAIVKARDLGQNNYRWELSLKSKFLDTNGLASVTSKQVNKIILKYYLVTDCDFTSSVYYLGRPGAELRCGDPVNAGYSFSKPIDIKGVKKPYFSAINLVMGTLDICKYNGKGSVRFINLGPDTTGVQDFIHLTLPKGIYLDTSYLKGTSNTPPSKPTFVDQIGVWIIPSGIQPGDSMLFEFDTYVNSSELDCGSTQILLNSVVTQPALCVSENKYCDIKVSTSSDIKLDSIKKAVFVLSYDDGVSTSQGANELSDIKYSISNVGTQKDSGVLLVVHFIDDQNQNGVHDKTEPIVYSDSIYQKIDQSTSPFNAQFTTSALSTCRLLMVIDSSNCVCSPTSLALPPIRVLNAGKDSTLCSRLDVPIGEKPGGAFTYRWTPSGSIQEPDSAQTTFNAINSSGTDALYRLILETDKGACKTSDTVLITLHPAMFMNLPKEEHLCEGERVIVGELVTGGTGFRTYQWSPTDSIEFPNKVKTWANPSQTTTYTLTATDGLQCSHSDSTKVVVHPIPEANFTFRDTCEDELYFFSNTSVQKDIGFDSVHWWIGPAESWDWEPIELIDSSYQIHTQLYVRDSFGCWDSTSKVLDVYPRPKADFIFSNACEFDTVNFTNTSNIKSGTFVSEWTADSKTFNSTDLSYRYGIWGQESVQLRVESDKGCVDSTTLTVDVYEKPNVSIVIDSVCEGESTNMKVESILLSGDTINYFHWDLGDGNQATSKQNLYRYAVDSTYDVSAIVRSQNSCSDTAFSKAVVYQKPEASFTVTTACLGDLSTARNTSQEIKYTTQDLLWDIGSGYSSGVDSIQTTFASIGEHAISLIVESTDGCRDTVNHHATVLHKENLAISQTGNCEYENIGLDYTPQYADSLSSIVWEFQSAQIGSSANIQHYFGVPGKHTLRLSVTTNMGCLSEKDFDITVDPRPVAAFNFDHPCTDNLVDFESTSSTPLGTLISTNWDMGDGSTFNTSTAQRRYTSIGNFDVQLEVENSFNCKDTAMQTVPVDYIVVPDFTAPDKCANDLVPVANTSSGAGLPMTNFLFDMGDGSTVTNSSSFNHVYAIGGNYTITMSFETSPGCVYDTFKTIQIYDAPTPGFDVDQDELDLVNNIIQVSDLSVGGTTYQYTISDGSSFSSPSFEHGFSDTGTFVISQRVTDDFGCYADFEKTVRVYMITHILVPNAFHPNKDGLNEIFRPEGLGIESYELEIYDRWGSIVFQTTESEAWDGSDYPPGVYAYRIRVNDHKGRFHEFKGTVHLLR